MDQEAAPNGARFDREQIYALVWSKPMTKVAEYLGLSDRGLAKTCDRMGVPTPDRGYWAKLTAGRRPSRPKLRNPRPGDELELIVSRSIPSHLSAHAAGLVEQLRGLHDLFVVRDTLGRPHPLVAKTRDYLRGRKGAAPPRWGNEVDVLDIRVTTESLERALRIMDALMLVFDKMGWRVTTVSHGNQQTSVEVYPGEQEKFDIFEARSGGLSLRLSQYIPGRSRFNDGQTRKLEDQLLDFVIRLVEEADRGHQIRLERHEEERLRQLEQARRLRQKQRSERLNEQLESWRFATDLKAFADALEESIAALPDAPPNVARWAAFARSQAEARNPLNHLLELPPDDEQVG